MVVLRIGNAATVYATARRRRAGRARYPRAAFDVAPVRMHESSPARRVLARLFGRPDEVMLELGASGELLVARVRALLSLLALALPLAAGLGAGDTGRTLLGLGIAVFVN